MKRLLILGVAISCLGVAVVLGGDGQAPSDGSDQKACAAAIRLFASLDDEQKKLALKPLNDKERFAEQFPAVERPGLPFAKLNAAQKAMVDEVVRGMTTAYGAERCLTVGKQTPDNRRYLFFFGEPVEGKPFAWRIAQHHLTLIYAEFSPSPAEEFGPVLLGGNPVNQLWEAEETIARALFDALGPDEKKKVAARGGTASTIGELNEKARDLARNLVKKRIEVFSADQQKTLVRLMERDGGVDALRINLSGDFSKSHRDGGSPNWRISSARVFLDWQTAGRNHLHLTVRVKSRA
jgi:hypothetical protein